MEYDRELDLARKLVLFIHRLYLRVAVEFVMVVIKPELAHRDHLVVRRELAQCVERFVGDGFGIIRVHADRRVNARIEMRRFHRRERRRQIAPYRYDNTESVGGHSIYYVLRAAENFLGYVRVRIRQHIRSPASPTGFTSRGSPSTVEHNSMPSDTIPHSLAGLRFATRTAFCPTSSLGAYA